jgi:hypothetical protein
MTEFAETKLRHYCRNPRCRSKLPTPLSNPREAFCVRGCYNSFYLHRCLACEGPIERKRENQRVCRKAKCRNALQARNGFGRYLPLSAPELASKTLDFIDAKVPLKPDRAWRVVAGPELSTSAFHCATIPDGPNGAWEGGGHRRIEARNWALLKEHFRKLAAECQIQPHNPPVNVLGGYRFTNTPAADLSPLPASKTTSVPHNPVPDDLSIPDLLRREALNAVLDVKEAA